MIKRYYVEEINGKETKRTLTTFNDIDDMRNYSDNEIQEMLYEATAELLSKSRKIQMLDKEILGREELGESDFDSRISSQSLHNILKTIDILLDDE